MNSAHRPKSQITPPLSDGDGPILDQFTARLIRRKAHQLVGRAGFTRSDREDIEQELRLKLLKHSSSYDPRQGHHHAFVTAVIERHAANLLRDKSAEKRDHRRICSLDAVIAVNEGRPVIRKDTIGQRQCDAHRGCSRRDEHELAQLAQDIADVAGGLPEDLRELCERLKRDSLSQVARDLGKPRSTLADRIRKVRQRFEDAGLKAYF